MPKYLKKLKTTALNRSLSYTEAAVKVGTKAAGHLKEIYRSGYRGGKTASVGETGRYHC